MAAPLIFGIAFQLFGYRTGVIAGALTALAPQFAYHSALFLPDELSVIPVLGALLVLSLARSDPRAMYAVGIGVLLGISCWLRANGLLLPFFFALAAVLLFPSARLRFAGILLAAFLATIAPIPIRNLLIFDSFVPLSLGSGTTFLEGLGDYDSDAKLAMPVHDEDVMRLDVTRSGRDDYYGYLYSPDGVQRERARIKDGIAVVAANPFWYAKAVGHRAVTSFRMERVPAIESTRDERETTPPILYYLNKPLKLIQRGFVTGVILPLFLFGLVIALSRDRRRTRLLPLAIIPVYFATVQSLIHTEYRYVLATPHMMIVFCAVAISWMIGKVWRPSEVDGIGNA
jgi:4-amino-4-deoxy-L-arabinose transferase-like glycosyltransferase